MKISHSRLVTVALVAVLATPLAVEVFTGTGGEPGLLTSSIMQARENALQGRASARRKQRQYWMAIEAFQMRVREGEQGLVPPNINDYNSILEYLGEGEEEAPPEVERASAPQTSSMDSQSLSDSDRLLLRRYSRANSCPESLKNYIPGFYELCLSVTRDASPEPRVGLINENVQLHSKVSPPPATLKLRLQMLQEAYDRTGCRTDGSMPLRPTPYVSPVEE